MDLLTKSLLLLLTAAKIRFFGDMVYRQILIFAIMEVSTGDAGVSPAVICPGTQASSPAESIYKFTNCSASSLSLVFGGKVNSFF